MARSNVITYLHAFSFSPRLKLAGSETAEYPDERSGARQK